VRSNEHTAQPSLGQFSWLKSANVNSGSCRCCTFRRICSALSVRRRTISRRSASSVVIGSMGRFANRWKEKACSSSWVNRRSVGASVVGLRSLLESAGIRRPLSVPRLVLTMSADGSCGVAYTDNNATNKAQRQPVAMYITTISSVSVVGAQEANSPGALA
jgi:hypothetical protein